MQIVRYLFTHARGTLVAAAVANAANGAASAGLIAWIHTMVSPERAEVAPLFATSTFLGLLALIFASGLIGQISLVRMAARSAFDIRLWLVRRVLSLPLRQLEQIGGDRVYACLTQDVATVSNAWIALPIIGFNAAVMIGGVGYLIWLSWQLSVVVLATLVLGLLAYQRLAARGRARMAQFREQQDTLYTHFEALVRGAKELRSSARRAEQLVHADLEPDTRALRDLQTQAFSTWALGTNWGNVLTLAGVGVVLVASGMLGGSPATAALGFVLALLFLRAHLAGVLNALPALAQGDVALRKLEALGLAGEDAPSPCNPVESVSTRPWKHLTLAGVEYGYGDSGGFRLGPLDLELLRGEIVFVTGGNGSGKSTFVKLLVGLYRPDAGEILLDGERVDPESESYRARFGALFSDYHLFSRLTTRTDADALPQARELLEQLGLASKVDASAERVFPGGLSAGERRRLAFVSAYLEQAEIYVLDEWAADQDPHYRAAFYHEYLPALRERGATVVVITHDDRYFHCGDRLLHFEEGKATWQPGEPARRLAVEPA